MALAGKYELVRNENHLEHMIAAGVPEEYAKKSLELKSLEISISGDKVTLDRGDGGTPKQFILGQEIEDKAPNGKAFKNKATLNGDVLTVESDGDEEKWTRKYSLLGSELTVTSSLSKAGVPVGKRIYKKL